MLQRLFARNVPEERIDNAVDHGKAVEEQDVLRSRSALILERLARKQAAARQDEIEARRVAREAADRVPEEAKTAAPQPEPATTPTESDEEAAPATAEAPVAAPDGSSSAVSESVETARQDFEAPAAVHEEAGFGRAEPAADTTATQGSDYFSDDAPLRSDNTEARYEAPQAEPPAADDGFGVEPPMETPEGPEQVAPESGEPHHVEPAAEAQPAHAVPDIHDDSEAMEQIRLKAEEAKARIAARLQQMEAEESATTDASTGRLDLGENTPPVSPDDSDN